VGRTLIGGVGYRWQRDASFGLAVSDALAALEWPVEVEVADLGYGALYVSQDLADAQPPYTRLILIAAVRRDRAPGELYRDTWTPVVADAEEVQARVREAGAGVVDLDHLLIIANYFGTLPAEVITFELEPVDVSGGEGLSRGVEMLLPRVVEDIRRIVGEGVLA
jgi:hydrogenase maturation protease